MLEVPGSVSGLRRRGFVPTTRLSFTVRTRWLREGASLDGEGSGVQWCAYALESRIKDLQPGFELIELGSGMDHAAQSPGQWAISGSV